MLFPSLRRLPLGEALYLFFLHWEHSHWNFDCINPQSVIERAKHRLETWDHYRTEFERQVSFSFVLTSETIPKLSGTHVLYL